MGLFDEVNKAVADQQQVNNYTAVLQNAGITITDLRVADNSGTLTVAGKVSGAEDAEKAEAALKAEPGITSVINLLETEDLSSQNIKMQVVTQESNLNIRIGPGTDFSLAGKAAHNSIVQLIKKMYNDWYYIKTDQGIEGFCYKDYLKDV